MSGRGGQLGVDVWIPCPTLATHEWEALRADSGSGTETSNDSSGLSWFVEAVGV